MIDGYPDYLRLSSSAMSDVILMGEAERIVFINALCDMFVCSMDENYSPEECGGFVGRAIRRQFEEMQRGISVYMKNVYNGRKQQKTGSASALDTHRIGSASAVPRPTEQNITEQKLEQKLEQTRTELKQRGFALSEINDAISSVKDWPKVNNPTTYLSGVIRNKQKQKRTVSAQNYKQRDYSDVQTDIEERQAAEMEEYLRQSRQEADR